MHALLVVVQQIGQRVLAVHAGRRHHGAVRQAGATVHADVHLHAEVPLLALARLMHLGVARLVGVLRRTGRADAGGVNDGARAYLQASGLQHPADRGEQLLARLVLLEQPTERQQRGAVGH
jgi:hypothetical protein